MPFPARIRARSGQAARELAFALIVPIMVFRASVHIIAASVCAAYEGRTIMARTYAALCAMFLLAGGDAAWAQDTLKIAIPQRGAWDAGVAELGQRGGI